MEDEMEPAHISGKVKPSPENKKRVQNPAPGAIRLLVTLFVVIDVVVGLLVHKKYVSPFTSTWKDYLVSTGDELAIWTGRLFWLFIIIFLVLVPIVRGKAPRLIEPLEFAQGVLAWIREALNKKARALTAFAVLFIGFVGLLLLLKLAPSLASPASGHMVVPTLPGDLRLFIVRESSVIVLNRVSFTPIQVFAPIRSLENITVTKDLKRIFATEFEGGKLHELSTETGQETHSISVRHSASTVALRADGRKLYVAVQGPIPEGKIIVFDTDSPKLDQIASIGGLGCPVSLFAASPAPHLFGATQFRAGP